MNTLNKNNHHALKTMLFLFLVNSCFVFAQNPYIKTNSGIGQYGYLEKDASTPMLFNSNTFSNIYQLFGRTWLNSTNILTYPSSAVNDCTAATNIDQNTSVDYVFGANAIPGLIAYTSVHADYCGGSNSYSSNPNQTGFNERQHYIFDISDRPSDVTSNVIQLNPGTITSPYNVVMSVKIDFGSVSSRVLQRFWIQNTGTMAEASEIANDGFKLYYEPATGSETFDGTESNATIYGDYNANPTNNNLYGHDALNIPIPAGGLRIYVVLSKFASCVSTAKTVQVSLINDGLSFTPKMDTSYDLARVGQTPAAPATINVSYANATTGPLGGTYYIPSACFPTVASAVSTLNTNGLNAAVTFNVLAGYTETTPSGGFALLGSGAAGNLATGTVTNTITFKKFSTAANPTFTAFTPQAIASGSRYGDGIFRIIGGDYITLDGFTLLENNANTTTGASNNMTEFGVGLFYATVTNGAQNNTIKNCSIDLDRTYTNTIGIYSNTSHTSTSMTTNANATGAAGSNSNLTIIANSITDVNYGIVVIGAGGAAAPQNDGLVIGGTLANANTITNYGTGSASTTFSLMTTTVNGIIVRNTKNYNVSYNNITSSTAATVTTIRGIYFDDYSVGPTGTITNSVNNNSISVRSANTSGDIYGIQFNGSTGSNSTTTTSINNNDFFNFGYTSNSTGAVVFIYNNHGALNLNINNNTFTNNTINNSGSVTFIRNFISIPAGGTENVNSNRIVTGFTKSVANGAVMFYDSGSSSVSSATAVINQNSNNFSNVTVSGTSTITGWYNIDGASASTSKTFQNNTFSNITNTSGTGAIIVMDIDYGNNNLDTNTISSISGGGTVYGIRMGSNSGTNTANNNPISGLSSTTTTADVVAIWVVGGATQTITNNVISTITAATNAGSFKGIYLAIPGATSNTITGNFISGMTNSSTGTSAAVRGIHVSPASNANPVNISSNEIHDLSGATTNTGTGVSCAIVGILMTASTAATHTISLNKIYNLNATTSAASSISVAAIATGGVSAGGTINRNRIYGFTNTATGTNPFIVGFWPTGGNWTFANNMIAFTNGSYTNGMQCAGVYDSPATVTANTRNYYYNSINIGGSSTGTQNSVAFQYNSAANPTVNIYNNIFNMTRTGNGKNYALANLTAGLANMNCNYNILNAVNPATVVATSGITDNSFSQWQATGKDANSITEAVVSFTDITTADLHINNAACNSGEGAATPLSAPNNVDYDNQARDTIAPDIGADEFDTYTSTWDGTAWSTWNGVSFSTAIPTGNTNLVFAGNYSSSASLDGCACNVTSGNVIFNSSHNLTLLKKLTVAAGPTATMTFEDSSSLVQTQNIANSGNITYKRTATGIKGYDYVYWSSPVAAQSIGSIYSTPTPGYMYKWNPTASNINTVSTGTSGIWQAASGAMTPTTGYIVRGSSAFGMAATNITSNFIGVPNNGNLTANISRGGNTTASQTGTNLATVSNFDDNWNLLGNPYPSSIKALDFLAANTNIQGFVYLWTHYNAPTSTANPFYDSFAYNYYATDYITYNGTATTSGPSGPTTFNGYIGAGQGFFVLMNDGASTTQTVSFKNNMRSKTYSNSLFYKTSESNDEDKHRIWLDLLDSNNVPVRTVIGYVPEATNDLDRLYDAYKNIANERNIYSIAGDQTLIIQGRALPFDSTDQVQIGVRIKQGGDYKIAIGAVDGLFADSSQNIYLEDKLLNVIYDLRQNPYSFTSTAGIINDRFVLRYDSNALGNPDFETDNNIILTTNHGIMTIKSSIEAIQDVTVYDILGRQLFETKAIGNKDFSTSDISVNQQALIVKIKLENGVIVTRKIIL